MTNTPPLPIGTPVFAYPNVRPEDPLYARHGRVLDTVTRSEVWQLGDGSPVVKVEGYAGGIALTHVDRKDDQGSTTEIQLLLAETEAAWRRLQADHHSEPRRALYGRPGSMEMRCVVCNRPAPCSTWQIAQTQLEKLAA